MNATKYIFLLGFVCRTVLGAADWEEPKAPIAPEADGFVVIPGAVFVPDKSQEIRAVFDATRAGPKPTELCPALNMVGSELNALAVLGVPLSNAKFAIVFHGAALDDILTNESYREKFQVENPNLKLIASLKKAGVKLFVCGQNLASAKIDPKTIVPDVQIATDALLVLMIYQNERYALMSF